MVMQNYGRVAVYQGETARGDVAANIATVRDVAQQVRARDAHTVVFPELFLAGYDLGAERLRATAVAADGPEMAELAAIARGAGVNLIVPYCERKDGRYYNAAAVLDLTGRLLFNYRKCHLWSSYERDVFTPGVAEDLRTFRLPPHNLVCGMIICYDVEFPEPARALALQGAQLLFVPTALGEGPVEENVPLHVVPTRAMENQFYVAYCNYPYNATTPGALNIRWCGRSAIVNPLGSDVERATRDETRLLVGEIDLAEFLSLFARNPYMDDRRPALYGALTASSSSS
eukprot:Unigene13110_Nuclearia_a/m.39730 Unigene13110_Nuclearia_a/g.39730  ORF Unigene13110_Nuclearia_a/g.39730 Unigene13110_Nuclearia_a/m.39730 type:complete len:287 (-) Unigene13110_Nuclearia_a:31-891(-)